MSFLIPNQLIFKSSRHTALFLLSELYYTIENRLSAESNEEIQNILSNLLNSDPAHLKLISENSSDHSVIRFIKFYLEFNHISDRFHRIYLTKEKHVIPKLMSEFESSRQNIKDEEFKKFLSDIEIDLVFTAHPTEIFERKILKKYIEIHKNLKNLLELNDFDPHASLTKDRRTDLLSLWLSPDFGAHRPKAKDEAKLAQLIFQYSLWNGITGFKKKFYEIIRHHHLPLDSNKNVLKFSSWMGGDRDGNPNVTALATAQIIKSFSKKSLNLYFRDLKRLKEDLSFDIQLNNQTVSAEKIVEELQDVLSELMKDGYEISSILQAEHKFLSTLKLLYNALVEYQAKTLADRRLRSMIDRLESFGLLGMRWDVRQESSAHDHAIDEIFKDQLNNSSFVSMSEHQRIQWIDNSKKDFTNRLYQVQNLDSQNIDVDPTNSSIPSKDQPLSEETIDFVNTLFLIKKLGSKIIPYYIISMTRSASDLYLIQMLFNALEIKTQVVPLFETLEDLENSTSIVESFLSKCSSLLSKDQTIPIMLGYSDSAKTGSRLSSVWNLYLAQKKLVIVAHKQGFECQFFHGRGGSIGRGGGPVQHAIASCPIESLSKGFRMTIQGEVIFDRFGFTSIAVQTMLTYVMSLLNYKFSKRKDTADLESYENIFAEISEVSKLKYRSLIEAKGFFDYFEKVTPVSFMSDLNIGSRPSKRQSEKKSYRAIPWIFGWTQNRCLLPAWYGAGTALKHAVETHGLEKLQSLYNSFFLFRSTLDLIYMTYLKADLEIFKRYDQALAKDFNFRSEIDSEFNLLKEYLLMIVDSKKINNQVLEEKLYGRLEVLEYLHELQIQKLLQNQINPESFSESDKKTLLLTIQALASGMGNTG